MPSPPPAATDPWDRVVGVASWGTDIVLLGGAGVLVLVDLYLRVSLGRTLGTTALLGLAAVAAVALRRRGPGIAALALVGFDVGLLVTDGSDGAEVPSLAVMAALGLLLLLAARVERPPLAVAAALAVWFDVALLSLRLWQLSDLALLAIPVVTFFGGCTAAACYLRYLDGQRERAAVDARRDERLDLARELHDLVAHYVTGMVVQAQAGQVVAEKDPAAAAGALATIERAGADALAAMRRLVGTLREGEAPPTLVAGQAGLDALVTAGADLGLPVRLDADPAVLAALPPAVAASTHRIVQESLTNVRRHGVDVTVVDVRLGLVGGALRIAVRDDGRPTTRRTEPGYGLVGMAERATALGGTFHAGRDTATGGWTVDATIPLEVAR